MQLLLDTHIWLWSLHEPHKLTCVAQQALADPANQKFLSAISICEAMILVKKKRIVIHDDFTKWFLRTTDDLGLSEVGLGWKVFARCGTSCPITETQATSFLPPLP
jgi:PIN domain nuclease of toxin-antitoxin system